MGGENGPIGSKENLMPDTDRKRPAPPGKPEKRGGCSDDALQAAINNLERIRFNDRSADGLEGHGQSEPLQGNAHGLDELDNGELAIIEETPIESGKVRVNPAGLVKGYDPYDSGKLAKTKAEKRRDLRRLGEWMKLRRQPKPGQNEE